MVQNPFKHLDNFDPKPCRLLKMFISFVTTTKSRHEPTITWKKLRWKSLRLPILKSISEFMKNKSLYRFWGCCVCQNYRRFVICMDFKPWSKGHNLISFQPKRFKLGQMTNFNVFFHVMVSSYRLAKSWKTSWNSPQFSEPFGNGL